MTDIVDELNLLARNADANLAPNVSEILIRAAKEIEYLRSLVGAARVGPSFAEIAADLPKHDPHPER